MANARPLAERFWPKVDRRGPDECWPWVGACNRKGYGRISFGRGPGCGRPAARVSWELANGQAFPTGKFACHTCDNPGCVNPAHIWPGTNLENVQDRGAKGRHANQRKARCLRGHEFTPENTYYRKANGSRHCRVCLRFRAHRRDARVRLAGDPA